MNAENLSTLKINRLTQEQYDKALSEGRINEGEIYLTPDEEYITTEQFNNTVGDIETALDSIIAIQENLIGGGSE